MSRGIENKTTIIVKTNALLRAPTLMTIATGNRVTNKKGKGKSNRTAQGNRTKKGLCNYCSKDGHEARECRKRIYDEKQKSKTPQQTNNAQHLTIDETAIMFTQNVVFALTSDGVNEFKELDDDLEGDDTTNVPLVNLEYDFNDALDPNGEPTITHKENTLQLD